MAKNLSYSSPHYTVTVPRTLKGDGCDYTYYQAACSCGWHGVYRASKLTAQEEAQEHKDGQEAWSAKAGT